MVEVLPAVTGLLSFMVYIGKALAVFFYLSCLNVAFISFFVAQIFRMMS